MQNPTTPATPESVRVWDPVVRICHWSLVACVILNEFILEEGDSAHEWAGYIACGAVVIRFAWGFVGSTHARFADFFPTPQRLRLHWDALRRGIHPVYIGHNPLGAVMMLALMALVVSLGLTGWLQGTDAYFGEEWLQELHEVLANFLLAAAGLHAMAALLMSHFERVNLIGAMITGIKRFR